MRFTPLPLILTAISTASLVACGGGGSSPMTGVFLDAPVEGLEYVAGNTNKASTNAKGEFTCYSGDSVAFSLNGLALGSAPCATVITPLTLAGSTNVKADTVGNRLLTLQLLDEDSDPSNGIKITSAAKMALAGRSLDFAKAPAAFNTDLKAALAAVGEPYKSRTVDDERRLSAAHVVIGLQHLLLGRKDAARDSFKTALSFKVPAHFEQQIARAELARMR